MAYSIEKSENVIVPDGLATTKDIYNTIKSVGTPEFYELEPAEVIKVFLEDDDMPLDENGVPDYSFYGSIEARMAISSTTIETEYDPKTGEPIEIAGSKTIKPLDTNIKEYPMPGEYVIVAEYFGELFYTQKLNIYNSVNRNNFPGLSKVWDPFTPESYKLTDFEGNSDIRQVKAYDGDITFNGRFGQSIRFGSNITEITGSTPYPKSGPLDTEGLQSSPNIIIKAGQGKVPTVFNKPVLEDINSDGSSIWMTTNQTVGFTESSTEVHKETIPKKFDGNQIIVNSDRIVFNSKVNSIHAFSKTDISMAANLKINIESAKVSLGSMSAEQPAICGDAMMKKFEALCKALQTFSGQLSKLLPLFGNVGFPLPMFEVKAAGIELQKSMTALLTEDSLDYPKSKVVFVEKASGR